MKKEHSAAIVTIKDAPSMTRKWRKDIAAWLRRQAQFLEQHGQEFSHRFTGRYIYK